MATLPPPPMYAPSQSPAWLDWFTTIANLIETSDVVAHEHANKTILDAIEVAFTTALNAKLEGIETGAEVNNISDANVTDLTDGGATTLHKHAHNNMDSMQGGTSGEYYHLTSAQHADLTTEQASADQAAVVLGNADAEIGGLAIGAAYSQGEVQALRDKCEELADDVRSLSTLVHSLRTVLITAGLAKGSA